MKKYLIMILCAVICISFVGCSSNANEEFITTTTTTLSQIDVDLTSLSSTMVYSEVYNMMITPEDYEGKMVKMSGQFALYTNEEGTQNYYACVIADATACCQQGLEFVWNNHDYPQDFPEVGQEIEVTGTFETYQEGDLTYCHLIASDVSF
jgi:hypothetical protein